MAPYRLEVRGDHDGDEESLIEKIKEFLGHLHKTTSLSTAVYNSGQTSLSHADLVNDEPEAEKESEVEDTTSPISPAIPTPIVESPPVIPMPEVED